MAQTSPPAQLSKQPPPNISPVNAPPNASQFTPRKEFIRDQRVPSSFALLALSGANLVRLYNFPGPVISVLRRVLDPHNLIVAVREDASKHFFEFALDRRPWASPKSVDSEKLIVAILGAIFQCGYSFLSSIDYGREPDDRVAIAFSKPVPVPAPSAVGSYASSSTIVLSTPHRVPFAISFVSPSVLRVVDPPLASTPAIIQAVRGSWPLGVVSEKKLGESTYQFKLKGYKFFQEDNFATDSLQQILNLLSALDHHAFTLLTSLTLTSRSRKQDLWVFTGPTDGPQPGESAQSSPAGSSMELKSESNPYAAQASNEKLAPFSSSRLSASPAVPSPLNPAVAKLQGNTLRKASPKLGIPQAFKDEADSATNSPVENKQHPFSSSMGSVDMTGVGSGRGKGGERLSRSPDVFYVTGGIPGHGHLHGHRDEHNPWNAFSHTVTSPQGPPTLPYPAFLQEPGGRHSPPLQDALPLLSHSRNVSTDNAPSAIPPTTPPSHSTGAASPPYLTPQVESPTPTQPSRPDYFADQSSPADRSQDSVRRDKDGSLRDAPPDIPREPTPPLLPSAVFRDSALSITTGGRTSYEIPIHWTGRDPEPGHVSTLEQIKEVNEADWQRRLAPEIREHPREPQRPRMERASFGPMHTGAWAPRDERRSHDVVISMLPPTIREQPSQELDQHGRYTSRAMHKPSGTDSIKRDATKSPESSTSGGGTATSSRRRRSPTRRDPDGWVIVNIDRRDHRDKSSSTGRQTHSVSPTRRAKSPSHGPPTNRPMPHKRSSSDSRVGRSPTPQDGAPLSSMSAAAKAIVIIDAVGAKEKEQEKSSNSGFKKIFSKNREKGSRG